jgi:hypothetical protein
MIPKELGSSKKKHIPVSSNGDESIILTIMDEVNSK